MSTGRPPVVLVAGGIGDAYGMTRIANRLADKFIVMTAERRQSGTGMYAGLEEHANDLLALVCRISDQALFVGHSYGATIALCAAALKPDVCMGQVLVEPTLLTLLDNNDPERSRLTQFYQSVMEQLEDENAASAIADFVDETLGAGTWVSIPGERQATLVEARATYLAMLRSTIFDEVSREHLLKVSAKTLVLVGEQSVKGLRQIARRVARSLDNAQLEVVSGVGHGMFRSGPPWVLSRIATFLRSCSS
jgi:pimeloyl-ACP methyl ester carboxylesterase